MHDELGSECFTQVVNALDKIAATEIVWPNGLLHKGGPHRRLRGMFSPISIGEDECFLLAELIAVTRPGHCLVIGNGFGLSSCFLAQVLRKTNEGNIVSIDDMSEGDGETCASVATKLASALGQRQLRIEIGTSPKDLQKIAEGELFDFVLIDGEHRHPQPTLDFCDALTICHEDAIFVWHDSWRDGVARGIRVASAKGHYVLGFTTSCETVMTCKNPTTYAMLRDVFPMGIEGFRSRWSAVSWLILAYHKAEYSFARMFTRLVE